MPENGKFSKGVEIGQRINKAGWVKHIWGVIKGHDANQSRGIDTEKTAGNSWFGQGLPSFSRLECSGMIYGYRTPTFLGLGVPTLALSELRLQEYHLASLVLFKWRDGVVLPRLVPSNSWAKRYPPSWPPKVAGKQVVCVTCAWTKLTINWQLWISTEAAILFKIAGQCQSYLPPSPVCRLSSFDYSIGRIGFPAGRNFLCFGVVSICNRIKIRFPNCSYNSPASGILVECISTTSYHCPIWEILYEVGKWGAMQKQMLRIFLHPYHRHHAMDYLLGLVCTLRPLKTIIQCRIW